MKSDKGMKEMSGVTNTKQSDERSVRQSISMTVNQHTVCVSVCVCVCVCVCVSVWFPSVVLVSLCFSCVRNRVSLCCLVSVG